MFKVAHFALGMAVELFFIPLFRGIKKAGTYSPTTLER
jgi:hypothetical protein